MSICVSLQCLGLNQALVLPILVLLHLFSVPLFVALVGEALFCYKVCSLNLHVVFLGCACVCACVCVWVCVHIDIY